MNSMKNYKCIFQLVVFSVIMSLIGILFQWVSPKYASIAIPFIIIFFFLITLLTLYLILHTPSQLSEKKFIVRYMLSRIIKLIAIFLFLVLYLVFKKEDRWNFVGAFMVIYFSYSIFEIFILKNKR